VLIFLVVALHVEDQTNAVMILLMGTNVTILQPMIVLEELNCVGKAKALAATSAMIQQPTTVCLQAL